MIRKTCGFWELSGSDTEAAATGLRPYPFEQMAKVITATNRTGLPGSQNHTKLPGRTSVLFRETQCGTDMLLRDFRAAGTIADVRAWIARGFSSVSGSCASYASAPH